MDSDPARAALAAFREATACSAQHRAENLRAIEARMAERERVVPPANRRIGIVVAVLAAAALAVWVARDVSRSTVAEREAGSRSQASDDAKGKAPAHAVMPVATPPTTTTTTRTPTTVEVEAPSRAPAVRRPEKVEVAPEDLLAREAASLKAAREALARGDLDVAERELAALDREIPQGELLEERRIVAQRLRCARGDAIACTKSP